MSATGVKLNVLPVDGCGVDVTADVLVAIGTAVLVGSGVLVDGAVGVLVVIGVDVLVGRVIGVALGTALDGMIITGAAKGA